MYKFENIISRIELEVKNTINLNKEQVLNLIGTYYIYSNLDIKSGSFHEEKYKTYNLIYLAKQVQTGKTPLEIMNNIITECEDYSKKKIINKHLNNTKN
jgi:hypothetical protein